MNIINGGVHANNGLRIQEFMIRPDSAKNFMDAVEITIPDAPQSDEILIAVCLGIGGRPLKKSKNLIKKETINV